MEDGAKLILSGGHFPKACWDEVPVHWYIPSVPLVGKHQSLHKGPWSPPSHDNFQLMGHSRVDVENFNS